MSDFSALQRIENDGPAGEGLALWPAMNPADLVSGEPVQKGYLCEEDESEDYSAGVWDCTAFDDQPGPYPVDEFMLLLEGTVVMVLPDGTDVTVRAGEAFVIPKGFDCQWKMPETVRKIFMILDGATPGAASNLSLKRITTLSQDQISNGGDVANDAVSQTETHFVNHDGRMTVTSQTFAETFSGPAPSDARLIVHVAKGHLSFSDAPAHQFAAGESFYLKPGHSLNWQVAAGTRLLVSACTPPQS